MSGTGCISGRRVRTPEWQRSPRSPASPRTSRTPMPTRVLARSSGVRWVRVSECSSRSPRSSTRAYPARRRRPTRRSRSYRTSSSRRGPTSRSTPEQDQELQRVIAGLAHEVERADVRSPAAGDGLGRRPAAGAGRRDHPRAPAGRARRAAGHRQDLGREPVARYVTGDQPDEAARPVPPELRLRAVHRGPAARVADRRARSSSSASTASSSTS